MSQDDRILELVRKEPNDEIWQEALRMSELIFAGQQFEKVFEVTMRALAMAKHDDTIAALSTCLIEHLLEYDFSYFDRIERRIDQGDDKLLHALSLCSKFGSSQIDQNSQRWDLLIDKHCERLRSRFNRSGV